MRSEGACSVACAASLQLRVSVKKGIRRLPATCKSRRLVRFLNRKGAAGTTLA